MTQVVSSVVEEMARLIECVAAFGPEGALQVSIITSQGTNIKK